MSVRRHRAAVVGEGLSERVRPNASGRFISDDNSFDLDKCPLATARRPGTGCRASGNSPEHDVAITHLSTLQHGLSTKPLAPELSLRRAAIPA